MCETGTYSMNVLLLCLICVHMDLCSLSVGTLLSVESLTETALLYGQSELVSRA